MLLRFRRGVHESVTTRPGLLVRRHELCAGIIDKPHLDLKGIAHEEVGV